MDCKNCLNYEYDDNGEDWYDDDYYDDLRERREEELVSECLCGSCYIDKKGIFIRVADCCC